MPGEGPIHAAPHFLPSARDGCGRGHAASRIEPAAGEERGGVENASLGSWAGGFRSLCAPASVVSTTCEYFGNQQAFGRQLQENWWDTVEATLYDLQYVEQVCLFPACLCLVDATGGCP